MLQFCLKIVAGIALFLATFSNAHAVTAYSESNGDLSGDGLNPTVVVLVEGSNQILGTTGGGDRDYFVATVPNNFFLVQLIELAGTQAGQSGAFARGFLAIQSGPQVTLATNTMTAAGLLGWTHYVPTATDVDILPGMAIAANGSSGFSLPLGAGTYAFWLQDTTPGTFNYGFDLVLKVPEPSAGALMIMGFFALWGFSRRQNVRRR